MGDCSGIDVQELSLKDIPDNTDQHSMAEHTFNLPEDKVYSVHEIAECYSSTGY